MITIIGWLITGWIAGSVAEWMMPSPTPKPGWVTIAIGVAGSIVGGMIYGIVYGAGYSPAGIAWSCVGAVVCSMGYRWYTEAGS